MIAVLNGVIRLELEPIPDNALTRQTKVFTFCRLLAFLLYQLNGGIVFVFAIEFQKLGEHKFAA